MPPSSSIFIRRRVFISRLVGLLVLGAVGFAGYRSLRIARADWIEKDWDPVSIRKATALVDNPDYYRDWAQIEPSAGVMALEKAIALNPQNPVIRLELGWQAEEDKNYPEAEASLLKAVALDKSFAPLGTCAKKIR